MARGKKWPTLKKGQAVAIYWHDIVGSSTGDPDSSETAYSVTLGFFHGWKKINGKRCLRTHLTRYPGGGPADDPIGYDTYPVSTIEKVVILDFTEEPYGPEPVTEIQAVCTQITTQSGIRDLSNAVDKGSGRDGRKSRKIY